MKKALFISLALFLGLTFSTAQVNLTFNPVNGAKYRYVMDTSQDIEQSVMGQNLPMSQKITAVYEMQVLDKTGGDVKTSFKYSEMVYDLSSSVMNMRYDSKNPVAGSSPIDAALGKVFGSIVDKPFTVTVSADGTVKSITGLSEIVNEVINTFGNDQQSVMIKQAMQEQFSNETMKSTLEQAFKIYPGRTVNPGDSWDIEQDLGGMGMPLMSKSTYKLRSVDNGKAMVDLTSVIGGMEGNVAGTQTGTVEFDIASGLPLNVDMNQDMKGTMTANGMDVEMEIKSKVKSSTSRIY